MEFATVSPLKFWVTLFQSICFGRRKYKGQLDFLPGGSLLTGSGKSAIYLVLSFLRRTGVLVDKSQAVLVPRFLGYWVYNTINAAAPCAPSDMPEVKVVLVYHQYGFPQDMDRIQEYASSRGLIVIEDCAHCLESFYRGTRCGTIGHYAIFSLSKFAPLSPAGALIGSRELMEYSETIMSRAPRWQIVFKEVAKAFYESSDKYVNLGNRTAFLAMSYSLYPSATSLGAAAAKKLERTDFKREVQIRKSFYTSLRVCAGRHGLCDHLEEEGVVPYIVPLKGDLNKLEKLQNLLSSRGVPSAFLHFDVARNLLSPRFVKCLCLPCDSSNIVRHGTSILDTIEKGA
jgi:hypothetical protein